MLRKKKPLWIPVVTALIRKRDEVLVGLRPEGHALSGLWEFPGGKIEPGESPEVALHRELKEEIEIDSTIGALRLACTHTYGTTGIIILFYEVNYWRGEPKSAHHTAIRWIKIKDLRSLPLPAANQKALPDILAVLENP